MEPFDFDLPATDAPAGDDTPAAMPVADGFPGFDALPAEKRADILAAALKFGIQQDDPIFQIIVALEWHLTLYRDIPACIREAGHQAAELVNLTREGFREDRNQAVTAIHGVLTQFVKTARPSVQTAAAAGIQDGLRQLDTKALIAEIAGKVAERGAKEQTRRWLAIGIGGAGVAVLVAMGAGFFVGREVFPARDSFAEQSAVYMRQMECGTAGWKVQPGQVVCRNPSNGSAVVLQIPR